MLLLVGQVAFHESRSDVILLQAGAEADSHSTGNKRTSPLPKNKGQVRCAHGGAGVHSHITEDITQVTCLACAKRSRSACSDSHLVPFPPCLFD